MKVGILTYHRAYNYGACLQACALCDRLRQDGLDAEIIDFRTKTDVEYYSLSRWKVRRIIRRLPSFLFHRKRNQAFERGWKENSSYLSKRSFETDSIEEFNQWIDNKYGIIIVGSDEVWNAFSHRGFPTPYWLIGDQNAKKYAYAASAGADFCKLETEKVAIIEKALLEFDFISVRDRQTFESVQALIGNSKKAAVCCDPSFLYHYHVGKKDIYSLLNKKVKTNPKKKTVLVMTENRKVADKILFELGSQYNLISVYEWHRGYINVADLTPFEWLTVINSADFIVASYFHAVCFAIMQMTPFVAVATARKKNKLYNLLGGSELEEHLISDEDMINGVVSIKELMQKGVDSEKVGKFVDRQTETYKVFYDSLVKDCELK